MDKGKFQGELASRLGDIGIIHVTFNYGDKGMIPGPFEGSYILDYDILFIDKAIGSKTIQIQVKFQDLEHPFVTIEVKGKMLGFGYYAEEDPNNVWENRIIPDQKRVIKAIALDRIIIDIINNISESYQASI